MSEIAIIGTRDPSTDQHTYAHDLAARLTGDYRVIVVTGGADGIDHAAMWGTKPEPPLLQVVLPWATYNRNKIPPHAQITVFDPYVHFTWADSVNQYHPAPQRLTRGARALHARNFGIVFGRDLVVAFPGEDGGGGTAQGIRIAKDLQIPIMQFNKGSKLPPFDEFLKRALGYLS